MLFVLVWLVWAWREGGQLPASWGALGLALVLLLVVTILAVPVPRPHLSRGRVVMLSLAGAFAGWSYLSLLWADFPGAAWAGSGKTLVYITSFAFFALWPWTPRAGRRLLAVFSTSIAAIGAIVLGRAALADDPVRYFDGDRLVGTIGYANADVALWMLALFPAVYLGSTRGVPPVIRGFFLAASVLLLNLAVLGQSRAWFFALPVTIALFLLLVRQRLRCLLGLALVSVGTLAMLRPLLDVFERAEAGLPAGEALDTAALLTLVASLAVGLAALVWGLLDRRIQISPRAAKLLGGGIATLAAAALVAASLVAAQRIDHPSAWLSNRWADFSRGYSVGNEGSRFTGSLGTNRYQIWRVAWEEFIDHPVAGIGSDNFAGPYLLRRETHYEEPQNPHSTPLRLLSQLGIVGSSLFFGATGIAVVLALRRRRQLDATDGSTVGIAVLIFAYWLVHGSVDVFWEIPVLAACALGFLGLASAIEAPAAGDHLEPALPDGSQTAGGKRLARRTAVAGALVLAAYASVSLGSPPLADAYLRSGSGVWRENEQAAYNRLELAADFDPFSAEALMAKGSIAFRLDEHDLAQDAFVRALEREPRNWYGYTQLGLLAVDAQDYEGAASFIARARALNPRDPLLEIVERLIAARQPIDTDYINDLFRIKRNHSELQFLINHYFQVPPFTPSAS